MPERGIVSSRLASRQLGRSCPDTAYYMHGYRHIGLSAGVLVRMANNTPANSRGRTCVMARTCYWGIGVAARPWAGGGRSLPARVRWFRPSTGMRLGLRGPPNPAPPPGPPLPRHVHNALWFCWPGSAGGAHMGRLPDPLRASSPAPSPLPCVLVWGAGMVWGPGCSRAWPFAQSDFAIAASIAARTSSGNDVGASVRPVIMPVIRRTACCRLGLFGQ